MLILWWSSWKIPDSSQTSHSWCFSGLETVSSSWVWTGTFSAKSVLFKALEGQMKTWCQRDSGCGQMHPKLFEILRATGWCLREVLPRGIDASYLGTTCNILRAVWLVISITAHVCWHHFLTFWSLWGIWRDGFCEEEAGKTTYWKMLTVYPRAMETSKEGREKHLKKSLRRVVCLLSWARLQHSGTFLSLWHHIQQGLLKADTPRTFIEGPIPSTRTSFFFFQRSFRALYSSDTFPLEGKIATSTGNFSYYRKSSGSLPQSFLQSFMFF